MARAPKIKHVLTVGSDKYSFNSIDVYGTWGAAFGVAKAPTNDNTVYKGKLTADSFSDGKAIRLKARGTNGKTATTPGTSRDFTFVVSFEKAREALANIGSKNVTVLGKIYDLSDARIPGRRRFS